MGMVVSGVEVGWALGSRVGGGSVTGVAMVGDGLGKANGSGVAGVGTGGERGRRGGVAGGGEGRSLGEWRTGGQFCPPKPKRQRNSSLVKETKIPVKDSTRASRLSKCFIKKRTDVNYLSLTFGTA